MKAVAQELDQSLERKKATYKALKLEIAKLDEESEHLKIDLDEVDDELD